MVRLNGGVCTIGGHVAFVSTIIGAGGGGGGGGGGSSGAVLHWLIGKLKVS